MSDNLIRDECYGLIMSKAQTSYFAALHVMGAFMYWLGVSMPKGKKNYYIIFLFLFIFYMYIRNDV